MEGKRVMGLPHEILEVKNAIQTYKKLPDWESHSLENLLEAHKLLMSNLIGDTGKFRSSGVGIYNDTHLVHMSPPAERIPFLMKDLLAWSKNTSAHSLLKSCVFHYEFEFIHPFSDGNGRMGRLWQTLMLSEWNPLLAYLPIESLIKSRQQDYYTALEKSDKNADCSVFIEFMLTAIRDELNDGINDGIKLSETDKTVLKEIKKNPELTAQQLTGIIQRSLRTLERSIKKLKDQKYIKRQGSKKAGHWVLLRE